MDKLKSTIFVGVDPGSKNFAIVGLNSNGIITYAKMLKNTIWSTSQQNTELREVYRASIVELLHKLKPKHLICESFAVRGFATNLNELVNLMIGGLQMACDSAKVLEYMVTASTWKREFLKQGYDLDGHYDYARSIGLPPHIVDALLLATYLYDNLGFDHHSKNVTYKNLLKAAKMIDPIDKIKPKRGTTNGVPNCKGRSRRGM
jgi:hypothetical protein